MCPRGFSIIAHFNSVCRQAGLIAYIGCCNEYRVQRKVLILSIGRTYNLYWLLLWVQGIETGSDSVYRQDLKLILDDVMSTEYRDW